MGGGGGRSLKLLDAGMIYPISDSPWVSPVHCVPKKGGITVVANEENELIPTLIDSSGEFYGFSGYFQIPIDPQDQEKTTFTCPYGTFREPSQAILALVKCLPIHFNGIVLIVPLQFEKMLKRSEDHEFSILIGRSATLCVEKELIPMTHLLEKETPFVFSKDCIDAFETFKKKLIEAPILVVPD
ncbi:hypothetical protein Tco_0806895 [Tanacetum coccineum]